MANFFAISWTVAGPPLSRAFFAQGDGILQRRHQVDDLRSRRGHKAGAHLRGA
ncbi:hypothetical protein [Streptomyces sp. NPDC058579]|uniref:hypothetical protein n=1 Tax=Streptomyces sp. NPDC058579 TaxID=3346548 RepID=UPI0036574389